MERIRERFRLIRMMRVRGFPSPMPRIPTNLPSNEHSGRLTTTKGELIQVRRGGWIRQRDGEVLSRSISGITLTFASVGVGPIRRLASAHEDRERAVLQ